MLNLQKYFKAINDLGISQFNMHLNFKNSQGTINNWIHGTKEPRSSEEEIFIGTEACRKEPIYRNTRTGKSKSLGEDDFLTKLINNLEISEKEKNYLSAEYANSNYEDTLRYIIHLAKTKAEFVPTALSFEKENPVRPTVGVGQDHAVAAFSNGKVRSTGLNDDQQCNTHIWRDVVSVVGCWKASIGLHADGTCVATGLNVIGNGEMLRWTDIVSITAGNFHVLGLKADGSVVAFGRDPFGQCKVSDWFGIKAIAAGADHSVGLHSDGTVLATGKNDYGQCDVEGWKDVKQIAASANHTLALLTDGTVIGCGNLQSIRTEELTGSIAIATGDYHAVGLKVDGSVVNTGADVAGLSDVERWHHMIAVSAAFSSTIGVRSDGRVFVTHDKHKSYFLDTEGWTLFNDTSAVSTVSEFDAVISDFRQKLAAVKEQALKVSPYISQYHDNIKLLDFSLFPAEYKKLKEAAAGIYEIYHRVGSKPTLKSLSEIFLTAFCDVDNAIEDKDGDLCITDQTYEPFMDFLFTLNQLEPETRLIQEGMSFPELAERQVSDFTPLMGKMPRHK